MTIMERMEKFKVEKILCIDCNFKLNYAALNAKGKIEIKIWKRREKSNNYHQTKEEKQYHATLLQIRYYQLEKQFTWNIKIFFFKAL